MFDLESWELASYIVTVFGLPIAIFIFILEQRKERQNEDEEIYQKLSDEYQDFSKLLLENADLKLFSAPNSGNNFDAEQHERRRILFDILISLLERAYILVYEEEMPPQNQRLWATWDDFIRFWCRRADFREALPELLTGEDPEFGAYIRKILEEETRS